MLSHMLKAKLHMAKVTQAELWYDGSCAIDADLVALAGMRRRAALHVDHAELAPLASGVVREQPKAAGRAGHRPGLSLRRGVGPEALDERRRALRLAQP